MILRRLVVHRSPPTRIQRRPVLGQLQLALRPRERLAKRRRRARHRSAFFVALLVVGLGWGAGQLSYHDRLTIKDVQVVGASELSKKQVKTVFDVKLYDGAYHFFAVDNIFLFPRMRLERDLKDELPRIKKITISRQSLFAQAVQVTVEERSPRHRWCDSERCYFLDEGGFVFEEAKGARVGYEFRGGLSTQGSPIGQTFLRGRINDVLDLLSRLREADIIALSVVVENDKDFTVSLKRGFSLKVPFDARPHEVVRDLEQILASDALNGSLSQLDYVDLRFGNRVYYKVK